MSANQVVHLTRGNLNLIDRACQVLEDQVRKAVRFCAAKLIFYFNGWRLWKLGTHRTEWIYVTLAEIRQELLCEHSLHVIRAAIELMIQLGIVDRRHNPRNQQDRTYQYRLNVDALNELAVDGDPAEPVSNPSEDGEFRSEFPKFNAEQSFKTEDPIQTITAKQQTPDPVFSDRQEKVNQGIEKPRKKEKTANEPEIDPQAYEALLAELRSQGIPLNKQIETLLKGILKEWGAAAAAARLHDAIAAFVQQKQKKFISNPCGWLVSAIKHGYKPNQPRSQGGEPLPAEPGRSPSPPTPPSPPGFKDWFDKSKSLGLVTGSYRDGDRIRLILPDNSRIDWESFARHYTLEKLDHLDRWLKVAIARFGATKARIENCEIMIDYLRSDSEAWEYALKIYEE